jgi:hypothetical protein
MTGATKPKLTKKNKAATPFIIVTPTARNAPAQMLVNTRHAERIDGDREGATLLMRGPHGLERLEVAETRKVIEDAIKQPARPGFVTFHESLEGRPMHQVSFKLSDIRSVEPDAFGSKVRFHHDGSGTLEAYESFETACEMIGAAAFLA